MKKASLFLILLFMTICLVAQNQMNVYTIMTGEFNGSNMGYYMTSLDFNGDGYTDLVVEADGWNPSHYISPTDYNANGKLYFYPGGPGFNNIPEFVIEGSLRNQYRGSIINGGDLNGDGKEDLVMVTTAALANPDSTHGYKLYIFYGSDTPVTAPDVTLDFQEPHFYGLGVSSLGDINNDGFDDIAISTRDYSRSFAAVYVLLGDTLEIIPFMENHNGITGGTVKLNGIGDVNDDGIDDFHMIWGLDNSTNHKKLVVYSGNSAFPDCDSLTICENTNRYNISQACPLGDVNGDGIADFISDMDTTGRVWLGRANLSTAWDVELTPDFFNINGTGPMVVYTDLNGDGYDDVIGSDSSIGSGTGLAGVWMGSQAFNGTEDFHITHSLDYMAFGFAKAAGDFTGNGLGDVALSSPGWHEPGVYNDPGRVYIYAGNAGLFDTTVSNTDETIPPASLWAMEIYPNPLKDNKTNLSIKFTGKGYKSMSSATLTISNLKGQMVYQHKITEHELHAGNWSGKIKHSSCGVYLISIKKGNDTLITKKISVTR